MREVFIVVAAFFAMFGLVIGVICFASAWGCNGYENATGKATKFVAGNCYVQDGGAWYAWEEYKHRLVTKGTLK